MNGTQEDAVFHLRTMFARAGHDPLDVVSFATGVLRSTKLTVQRQLSEAGFAGARQLALMEVMLGDPALPVDRPVEAYINWSRWLARCECGGVEYVDLEQPIFMCCSCWNAPDGHAWRTVTLPPTAADATLTAGKVTLGVALQPVETREDIEAALLARLDPRTRNWNPAQTVTDLQIEAADANLAMAVTP